MNKNIKFLFALNLLLLGFHSFFALSLDPVVDKNVLYVHGFTGKPDGWEELVPAILQDSHVIAPALPDSKPVRGVNFSKLLYLISSFWGKHINRIDSDMGHDKDVGVILKEIPQKPFIAYGICRGGSALIHTIAKHNPEHLQAVVIEGAYASYPKLFYGLLSSYGLSTKYAESFAKFLFPAYKAGSLSCQKLIPLIKNKGLPILILHSKEDSVIPFAHSLMLYKAFKENGFRNVYLAELHGKHAYGVRDDRKAYLTAVHSFYKKHHLPYEAKYATADMESYTLNIARVTQRITHYYDGIKKNIQRNRSQLYNSSVGKLIITAARLKKELVKKY